MSSIDTVCRHSTRLQDSVQKHVDSKVTQDMQNDETALFFNFTCFHSQTFFNTTVITKELEFHDKEHLATSLTPGFLSTSHNHVTSFSTLP